jgi:chromosome segregation ATPase
MADYKRRHYEDIENTTYNKNKEVEALQKHEKELIEEINILLEKKKVDVNATEWLNKKLITNIQENISELKRGIENLKNYHKQQENKLKEKKEKLQQDLDILDKDIFQINEQKKFQESRKKLLEDTKKVNFSILYFFIKKFILNNLSLIK